MTKCDAVLDHMEAFYDAWIMTVGSATIDPLPAWSTDRIKALPIPSRRALQIERETLRVRCDGAVCDPAWRPIGNVNAFDDGLEAAAEVWRASLTPPDESQVSVVAGAGSAA